MQRVGRVDLLECFQFAVPQFHVFGHRVDCQVYAMYLSQLEHDVYMLHFPIQLKFSPRNKPGFGMTDGEVVERLWSYLRRFARMTKEMRPAHRIDDLSDALFHYSHKSKENLGDLLTTLIFVTAVYLFGYPHMYRAFAPCLVRKSHKHSSSVQE